MSLRISCQVSFYEMRATKVTAHSSTPHATEGSFALPHVDCRPTRVRISCIRDTVLMRLRHIRKLKAVRKLWLSFQLFEKLCTVAVIW